MAKADDHALKTLTRKVEAILFSANRPVLLKDIAGLIGADSKDVKQAVHELSDFYQKSNRAFHIFQIAGGYQMRTYPEFAGLITEAAEIKVRRFSNAALETLSIIAYKQPVTKASIEAYRTVDSGYAIKTLLEKDLIRIIRRADDLPGKPILYGTTDRFLEVFGFNRLSDLPSPEELELPADAENMSAERALTVSADLSIQAETEPMPGNRDLNNTPESSE